MYANKDDVLLNITKALNSDNNPWKVSVENGIIVGTWKWMDSTFFGPRTITEEQEKYRFEVVLTDDGKWQEKDIINSKKNSLNPLAGNFSGQTKYFSGKTWNKTIKIRFGKNKETGKTGIVMFNFDTNKIKEPIRDYLTRCGYVKL